MHRKGKCMFTIVSPAKNQQFSQQPWSEFATQRLFFEQSMQLIKVLSTYSEQELSQLMNISPALAHLNYERIHSGDFSDLSQGVSALFAFQGDVYRALGANSFAKEEIVFAQQHVGILSGLYGLLRPLDRILPYRLEMKTRLPIGEYKDLYQFWGTQLADALSARVLINLASNEYAKAALNGYKHTVITPVFKNYHQGKWKQIGILAKRARGAMLRYIILNKIVDPKGLQSFSALGYQFSASDSDQNSWVFLAHPASS